MLQSSPPQNSQKRNIFNLASTSEKKEVQAVINATIKRTKNEQGHGENQLLPFISMDHGLTCIFS
jgi:hypothetical protein